MRRGKERFRPGRRALALSIAALAVVPALPAHATHSYVVDRTDKGSIEVVSLRADGGPSTAQSGKPCNPEVIFPDFGADDGAAVSDDGRYVAFTSAASLHPADINPLTDIYVRDRKKGQTMLVTKTASGLSFDIPDVREGCINGSIDPMISSTGRFVAFVSRLPLTEETTISADDLPDLFYNVYVADLRSGEIVRVSRTPDGGFPNENSGHDGVSISDDGNIVAFISRATDLTGEDCEGCLPDVSSNLAATAPSQAYIYNREKETTTLLSHTKAGAPGTGATRNVSVSDNGKVAVFQSMAPDLLEGDLNFCPNLADAPSCTDVFAADVRTTELELISKTRDGSWGASKSTLHWNGGHGQVISSNGRFVVFDSGNPNTVPDAAQGVFVYDRTTGGVQRISVTSAGEVANLTWASMSDDGRYLIGWGSARTNTPDSHGQETWVHDRITGQTTAVQETASGNSLEIGTPRSISGDGRYYVFTSAHPFVGQDDNSVSDVFLRDLGPQGFGTLFKGQETPWVGTPPGNSAATSSVLMGDDEIDVLGGAPAASTDLVGGVVAYRPQLNDLYLRVEVRKMALPVGLSLLPGQVLGAALRTRSERYEVRFGDGAGLASPHLYRCAGDGSDCARLAALDGTVGTTGEAAVAAVPLELLGLENDKICGISLFASAPAFQKDEMSLLGGCRAPSRN